MYNPKERLYKFVPSTLQRTRYDVQVTVQNDSVVQRRKRLVASKVKKILYMHVVDLKHLYLEFEQSDGTLTVRDLCDLLESRGRHILRGEATTPRLALSTAAKFGTGNLMLYAVVSGPLDMPQYLALGKTAGCRVDGVNMYGTFDVLTAFGGRNNPYTDLSVEYRSQTNQYSTELHWDITPRESLCKLLKRGFVKPYVQKFHQLYVDLQDPAKVRQLIENAPAAARGVLFMRMLFTSSVVAEQAFLQVFQHS